MSHNHNWTANKAVCLGALFAFLLIACAVPLAAPTAVPATAPLATADPVVPTASATSAPSAIPASATPLPLATPTVDVIATLDAFMITAQQKLGFAGAVLVAHNGQILLSQGYGLADAEHKVSNTPHTKFLLASVTKQFTAMGIMLLANQGKLDLQASICQYLAGCPSQWRPITLQQLLTHSSGVPDYRTLGIFGSIQATPAALTQTQALFRDLPLDFAPGAQYEYSSSNYFLLGQVIEQVSGQAYGDFLRQHIFEPLGMADSGYDPAPAGLAIGYTTGSTPAAIEDASVGFSAASMYSTVEDLNRWDQALYTTTLIPRAALDKIFTPYVATDVQNQSYGYGWVITTDKGRRLFEHTGIMSGFRTEIARYVDDHLVIIVLSNEEATDADSIRQELADRVLR